MREKSSAATPTGLPSTMTCYAFDDLERWRSIYPADVFEKQLRLLSEGWRQGLELLESLPDCDLKRAAWGSYALFRASYLQTHFIRCRDEGDQMGMRTAAAEERELALLMYDLMQKSALFGYEAANHYYFNKGMLAEKVLNCEYIIEKLKKEIK